METGNRSQRGPNARDFVSVEIKSEENLILSIKEHLESVSISHCMCRVPHNISRENGENYFPQLVSIGPFHHGKTKCLPTEDKKWRYLNTLLSRKPNLGATLDTCVKALKELEPKVRKFYGEKINFDSNELAKMMLVDGCFIIEILLKYSIKGLRRRDDPFFTKKETFFRLRYDIILLENQIPFFVLQTLFSLVPIPEQCTQSLTELALLFLRRMIPIDFEILLGKFKQDSNHLLDLIHNCYLPTYPEVESSGALRNLDCATKIKEMGIGFKKATTESLLDIKFVKRVLEIPPLKFHDFTEILFRNLIALENCYRDRAKHITSYALLMEKFIQSEGDVRLLYKTQILTNGLVRKEEILDLFKKLHVEMDAKDFYYKEICEQVNMYKRSSGRVWCGKMKERYLRTPLGVVGVILGIVFLVLTFTGTLFSILSFSIHHF